MDEKSNTKSELAQKEERILSFWKENDIFSKSLSESKGKKEFVFYEGPPTANGKPGIHHLEARAFKDVIPRYKTMRGYHVRRKAGWDTHGLPVELEVEKELGLKSKKEIEAFGISEFNKRCKKSVWKYLDLWNVFTERIGYWVDQKDPYITYDKNYMESVWNVIKTIDDKKLLYKDYKIVPWCPRCGTALSSHELAQGYKDVKDLSVYVKFKVKDQNNTFILAWTTTPWTLLGNVALAVGEEISYVKIKQGEDILILAKDRLSVIEGEYKILEEIQGKDLIGLEYEPLYSYLKESISDVEKDKLEKAFKVYGASFVTTEDGTGVVHTAVMYGADDFDLGTKIGLPKFHLVGDDGNFLGFTGSFAGKFVKDEDTAVEIIKDLAHRGLLLKKEKYEHSYPHCWRCKTPLIYFARDSWYVKMSVLRDELVSENKKINWEPEYTKEGRFGEWLREVKDWAISRERYWGTPLPIWICDDCGEKHVVGSIEDIKKNVKKSGNKYFVMRHGESQGNVSEFVKDVSDEKIVLTENGKNQVLESAKNFKEKIDIFISSPYQRTKQTTKIICDELGFVENEVIYENNIRELEIDPFFEGKATSILKQYYDHEYTHSPFKEFQKGENFAQVVKRMGDFIYDLEKKYESKNIFIVGHGIASRALQFVIDGITFDDLAKENTLIQLKNAEIKEFDFVPLPHNDEYELDLHKPYVDDVKLVCACGGKMQRVKEVMDVWFDSGTMPFSQDHYPFSNKEILYPADYISEAIDQTRGWFYTLLAVGVLMGKGTPFKNVICLGHILDKEGKKMSKSIGNVIDPWMMIDKYGVDTLRLWMYGVNQPGESKNFDEKTVMELNRQVFGLLYNVLTFYELYRDTSLEPSVQSLKPTNILDKWILAKLDELVSLSTTKMDDYKVLEPTRAIKDFIGDLSTWYLRRSRDRIKEGDKEAKQTLYFVLKTLVKIMAPFSPFSAEDIYLKLKNENDKESVHLETWPEVNKVDSILINNMEEVRKIVSLGLEARQKAGLKVRQPLASLKLKVEGEKLSSEYLELIKDEVNIKEVIFDDKIEGEVLLDVNITPELKIEGDYRELIRAIQDLRKKEELISSDVVVLNIETDTEGQSLINKFKEDLIKTINAKEINFSSVEGEPARMTEVIQSGGEVKVNDLVFKIKIER